MANTNYILYLYALSDQIKHNCIIFFTAFVVTWYLHVSYLKNHGKYFCIRSLPFSTKKDIGIVVIISSGHGASIDVFFRVLFRTKSQEQVLFCLLYV